MAKKIAVFSMTPLFPELALGGAQKQLKKVAQHLGELGHHVTILCTRRHDTSQPFKWHENVEILPVLRFKQPYPEPYFTPLYHIANAISAVGAAIAEADVHYSHDGGLIFPYVYQDKPTVISLRSILFAETLQSALLFQGDEWILPSEHTRASYEAVVGQFAPAVGERMHAVHNGFDWRHFRYTKPDAIFRVIPPKIAEHPVMLFPHRPESSKGIDEVIQVAALLKRSYGWDDLRVLAPLWLDADSEPSQRDYYAGLRRKISEAGLDDVFVFHDWINDRLIAEYYSLADVTLCIGSYVETFGNTPFESLGCGTLPIVSRVGPYRDLLPDEHIARVDYGDIEATAAIAHETLTARRRTSPATLRYLQSQFSQTDMVDSYADIILNARKKPRLTYRMPQLADDTLYRLAPWCYISPERGIYHDFRADFQAEAELVRAAQTYPAGFSGRAVDAAQLRFWLDEGYVSPLVGR
ncbi:MAG: glycosyltransferase family 4 protein [Chloroflexi bacterium]|nr:glycosyltransferase family 4 protein [Chloroflexota bacterium]